MQPVKYAVCLLSVCSAMTAPAVVESLSLDLTAAAQPTVLPEWVDDVAADALPTEAGLPLPFDSGLTIVVDRATAPCRLAFTVEGFRRP